MEILKASKSQGLILVRGLLIMMILLTKMLVIHPLLSAQVAKLVFAYALYVITP